MKVTAQFVHGTIPFNKAAEEHLVLSLQAPKLDNAAQRPALCIIPLIDVSSSMAGDKIAYAKRSLDKLIEHLGPNDYCGLVSFSGHVREESAPIKCTTEAKAELKRKVAELRAGGSTNIADALLTGLRAANQMDLSASVVTRVILFTDGEANVGPVYAPKDLVQLMSTNRGIASVSAFGYGLDAMQDFLLELAKTGNGNYAYLHNPDDALSALGKELGGLMSTYATGLTLEVTPLAGHEIEQVVSDVEADEDDLGSVTIKIPDVLAEETRHVVVKVKLKEQANAFPREVNVFDIKCGYSVLDSNMKAEHKLLDVKAKIQFVKDGDQAKPDAELQKIVGLAEVVRAQLEAEAYANSGNYAAAAATMNTVSTNLRSKGIVEIAEISDYIGASVGSSINYASSAAERTGISRGVTRSTGGTYSVSASNMLRGAGVRLSTASQDLMEQAFSGADENAAPQQDQPGVLDVDDVLSSFSYQPSVATTGSIIWHQPSVTGSVPLTHTVGQLDIVPTVTTPITTVVPVEAEKPKAKRQRVKQRKKSW